MSVPAVPGSSLSSADGSRQAGLMMNLHFSPDATFAAFGVAANQTLAGLRCADAPGARLDEALRAPR